MTSFRPCRECRDWNTCLLTDSEKHWFSYRDIRFCPHHIFFLLKYENIIRGRAWPVEEQAPGGSSSQYLNDAAWVSVSVVLAEVDARLDKTGLKGEVLRSQCKEEARDRIEYLSDSAKDALYYISGNRKATSFSKWVAKRGARRRERDKKYPRKNPKRQKLATI